MSIPCRCRKCGKRKSITYKRWREIGRKISEWKYKCPCGNKSWRVDKWRIHNELGIHPSCDCGGYWFRHRSGSKWCEHNPRRDELETRGEA